MPKISVIMSVYNQIQYLDDALISILQQTENDFEIVVFDDGSSEPVWQKLVQYGRLDGRVKPHAGGSRKGLTWRLNQCLDIARGDFLVRMDADDISLPERFAKQLTLFQEHVGFVGCWASSIDGNGIPIQHYVDLNCRCTDDDIANVYPVRHCLVDASVMVSREAAQAVGYYDEEVKNGESYNYYRRIQRFYDGRVVPEVLYIRRVGTGNTQRIGNVDVFQLANARAVTHTVIRDYKNEKSLLGKRRTELGL